MGGSVIEAALRGRLKRSSRDQVLVGDTVDLHSHDDGSFTIEGVRSRRTLLRRRSPGKSRGTRKIAANIDQVVVVGAARCPTWTPQLIDRFTCVAEANELPVVVVMNKSDLLPGCEEMMAPYRGAGYATVVTSVPDRHGLEQLRGHLRACVSLLTGPTGVGKSSLLNALQPGLQLRTGEVSGRTHTGRHTTVAAEMYPFEGDGFVVDTPGLRDIGLWGLSSHEVAAAFPEFGPFASHCRFDNCRHVTEPDCGVAEAVERGELAVTRLASYRRFLEEARQAARPWA